MTHEFRDLMNTALRWQKKGRKMVLATVVALEGSSYRRPGVRMLINDNGQWTGAVSGGCVEKEVYHQARSVFENRKAKLMSYDGRLRLGCEGVIHILLEPFAISSDFSLAFQRVLDHRKKFTSRSYYNLDPESLKHTAKMGTVVHIGMDQFTFSPEITAEKNEELSCFEQEFNPVFQLCIIGAEHDAVALSRIASDTGWDVHILASPDEQKTIDFFKGAKSLSTPGFEEINTSMFDSSTAIMLMTHSFNKDVQYLMALKDVRPAYFGLLGPQHRRERLFSKFLEYLPETEPGFFERIHGPAGIHIGAENAHEIAISVIAEILSVVRGTQPIPLKDKTGKIHE